MEYVLCFIISVISMIYAEKNFEKTGKSINQYTVIAFLIPTLLAGLRDMNIGIDVTWYVTPTFNTAKKINDLSSFLTFIEEGDIGFFAYAYLITKLFNSLWILMTFNHAIIIGGLIYALFFLKKTYRICIWFGFAIWLLYYYNFSLCIIRQSMSMSIALIAMVMLYKKKWLYFYTWSFIAISFHQTTIIFIALLLLFYFISFRVRNRKMISIMVVLILSSILWGKFMLSKFLPLLSSKYSDRLADSESLGGGILTMIFLFLVAIVPFYYLLQKKKDVFIPFFIYFPLIGLVIFIISREFNYLSRMAFPFNEMMVFSLSYVIKKKSMQLLFIVTLIINWIVSICIRGDWDTYPYVLANII